MKMKSILTLLITCCMIFAFAGCDSDSSSAGGPDLSGQHLGWIMYSDGTYTQEYDSSKTAIGIIVECDDDTGAPEKILSHKMGTACAWAIDWGATHNCGTKTDDGEYNLAIIQQLILNTSESMTIFPVFNTAYNWADPVPDGWEKWYVPASEDFLKITLNYEKITAALDKFGSMSGLVDFSQEFWTSSQSGSTTAYKVSVDGGAYNISSSAKTESYNAVFMTEICD